MGRIRLSRRGSLRGTPHPNPPPQGGRERIGPLPAWAGGLEWGRGGTKHQPPNPAHEPLTRLYPDVGWRGFRPTKPREEPASVSQPRRETTSKASGSADGLRSGRYAEIGSDRGEVSRKARTVPQMIAVMQTAPTATAIARATPGGFVWALAPKPSTAIQTAVEKHLRANEILSVSWL